MNRLAISDLHVTEQRRWQIKLIPRQICPLGRGFFMLFLKTKAGVTTR
jgi:hypothetical protein